jgi:putative membrane protein
MLIVIGSTGENIMTSRFSLHARVVALSACAAFVTSAWSIGALAQTNAVGASETTGQQLSAGDEEFVQNAGEAGATEIAASRLALKQSQNAQVRQFAQRMIQDHTRLAHDLSAVAARKGVTVEPQPDAQLIGKLKTLKGKTFDEAYVEQVALEGHEQAVQLFQDESHGGTDPDLKNAAAKALPTIEHHLEMAKQLTAATVKGSS